MSKKDYEVEHQIKLDNSEQQAFNADAMKTLRYVIRRMQDEHKKNWTPNDMVALLDKLIDEIDAGITLDDIERTRVVKAGERAFIAGKARHENPYAQYDKAHGWWDSGWHDLERQQQDGTQIHSGRQKGIKKPGRYLIQAVRDNRMQEWNDVLHMWVDAGNGLRFVELAEAQMLANSLKSTIPGGHVSVIDTFSTT